MRKNNDSILRRRAAAGILTACLLLGQGASGAFAEESANSEGALSADTAAAIRADNPAEPVFLPETEESDAADTAEKTVTVPETHPAYLFADESGLYHPERILTRRDMAKMLYALLGSPEADIADNFTDISADDADAVACAAVKQAGLIRSTRLHPERTVTYAELTAALSALYPDAEASTDGADGEAANAPGGDAAALRDEEITRADAACIVNRFAGRTPNVSKINRLFSVLPDMERSDPEYYEVAEAVLTHTCTVAEDDGDEQWLSHDSFRVWPRGLATIDGKLMYISDEGTLARNTEVDGFAFDDNGCYTTGMAELDELVASILAEVTPDCETDLERLQAAYLYVIHIGQYRMGNIYSPGETGWVQEEAYKMLSTGYGNCYSYAAAFCVLARALGFQAEAWSGSVVSENYNLTPHGWVEIAYEGVNYVCDPELQDVKLEDLFMMEIGTPNCDRWKYTKE